MVRRKSAIAVIAGSTHAPYHLRLVEFLNQRWETVAVSIFEENTAERVAIAYVNGDQRLKISRPLRRRVGSSGNLQNFFMSFLLSITEMSAASRILGVRFDICVAQGTYEALIAIILKQVGVTRKVVYWAVDWFPRRSLDSGFLSSVESMFFPLVDCICVALADRCWTVTPRIAIARDKHWNHGGFQETLTVPPILSLPKVRSAHNGSAVLGYVGALMPGRGLEKSIELTSRLRGSGIDAKLEIIGSGPQEYVSGLKELAEKLKIAGSISFLGERDALGLLSSWSFGLALYDLDPQNHSYYAWPLKIMLYLENCLPIITSAQTSIAKEIAQFNAGIIMESLDQALPLVSDALHNSQKMDSYLEGVRRVAAKYANGESLMNELASL